MEATTLNSSQKKTKGDEVFSFGDYVKLIRPVPEGDIDPVYWPSDFLTILACEKRDSCIVATVLLNPGHLLQKTKKFNVKTSLLRHDDEDRPTGPKGTLVTGNRIKWKDETALVLWSEPGLQMAEVIFENQNVEQISISEDLTEKHMSDQIRVGDFVKPVRNFARVLASYPENEFKYFGKKFNMDWSLAHVLALRDARLDT